MLKYPSRLSGHRHLDTSSADTVYNHKNSMQNDSDMFVDKRTKIEYIWNHYYLARCLITILMALTVLSVVHGDHVSKFAIGNSSEINTNCSLHSTCTQCTKHTCKWSNEHQMCNDVKISTTKNIIVDDKFCLKYNVSHFEKIVNESFNKNVTVTTFHVSLTNETKEQRTFIDFLNNTKNKECRFDKSQCEIMMQYNHIECNCRSSLMIKNVMYFWIAFDNIPLRFENITHHYVVKKAGCHSCVECQWDEYPNRYYSMWCPENFKCDTKEIRKIEDFSTYRHHEVLTIIGDQCSAVMINRTELTNSELRGIDKNVTITVHNHQLMLKSTRGSTSVRIAGRNCINLQDNNDTITCTVPQSPNITVNSGPLYVMYSNMFGYNTITLQSVNQFNWTSANANCVTKNSATINPNQIFIGYLPRIPEFRVQGHDLKYLKTFKYESKDRHINMTLKSNTCTVMSDTLAACQPPTFIDSPQNIIFDLSYKLIFKLNFNLEIDGKSPKSSTAELWIYPNPIFMVNGCCTIAINGLNLGLGYNYSNLLIQWEKNSSSNCLDPEVTNKQIICQLSSTLSPLCTTINLTIDHFWTQSFKMKPISQGAQSRRHSNYLSTVFAIGAYVTFIVFLCIILFRLKKSKNYDLLTFYQHQTSTELKHYDKTQNTSETIPLNEHQ